MRLFVALQLKDEAVRSRLAEYEKELERTGADIRLVSPQLLHITLKFIGEIADNQVEKIAESLEQVKGKTFTVNFDTVGAFPSLRRINVVKIDSEGFAFYLLERLCYLLNLVISNLADKLQCYMQQLRGNKPDICSRPL